MFYWVLRNDATISWSRQAAYQPKNQSRNQVSLVGPLLRPLVERSIPAVKLARVLCGHYVQLRGVIQVNCKLSRSQADDFQAPLGTRRNRRRY